MKNKVIINEQKIDKFDYDFYIKNKNYKVASALKALDATNEVQKAYFKAGDLAKEDYILRLYALLQALFVSIDSLYSLTLSLAKSKDYININNNPKIRTLRYIRNDVVGHPANRILDSKDESYCILDTDSVSLDSFSYTIYSYDDAVVKTINVKELLDAYYDEANTLLDSLYNDSKKDLNKNKLEILISSALDKFEQKRDFYNDLNDFIIEYKKIYKNPSSITHRVLWRYETINLINNIDTNCDKEKEFYNYIIGVLITKIYSLVTGKVYSFYRINLPDYVRGFYRFLNKNSSMAEIVHNLLDSENPYFLSSLKRLKKEAMNKCFIDAINYLDLIYKHYSLNEHTILNAIALPIKDYRRKK